MSTLELQQALAKEIAFINDEKFLIEFNDHD
jgi:hypothetical protein